MKLQTRYNRTTITATIFVLVLGSIAYYFLIRFALIRQVDSTLRVEEQEIYDYIKNNHALPAQTRYRDQRIKFTETTNPPLRIFNTREILDTSENEMDLSRELVFPVYVQGRPYTASVSKSQVETDELIFLILLISTGIILLLLVLLFILNRYFFKKLWQPFYSTLGLMEQFDITNPGNILLKEEKIDEFNALRLAVSKMTAKMKQDYESLKIFADNASHEIQTPLAIIQSNLDLLIQESSMSEKSMQRLGSIYHAVEKLSKVNQALLLLSKIENRQYETKSTIAFESLVTQKLQQFDELIQAKKITVMFDYEHVEVCMNEVLADIMITNLLSNALRHNCERGEIIIHCSGNRFSIANRGNVNRINPGHLFNRFEKSPGSEGIGLGLAIVKQVCDLYHFKIDYRYNIGLHEFEIIFN